MMSDQLREDLAMSVRFLYQQKLLSATGHLSVLLDSGDRFLINPLNVLARDVRADQVLTVDMDGNVVEGDDVAPAEIVIHTEFFKARPDIRSVCHFHAPIATTFPIAGVQLEPVFFLAAVFRDGINEHPIPDLVVTPEQAQELAKSLGTGRAVIIRGHGCNVVGENLSACVSGCYYLEENARFQYQAMQIGKHVPLSKEEMDRSYNLGKKASLRFWSYVKNTAGRT